MENQKFRLTKDSEIKETLYWFKGGAEQRFYTGTLPSFILFNPNLVDSQNLPKPSWNPHLLCLFKLHTLPCLSELDLLPEFYNCIVEQQ
jgi:hypothetical protein